MTQILWFVGDDDQVLRTEIPDDEDIGFGLSLGVPCPYHELRDGREVVKLVYSANSLHGFTDGRFHCAPRGVDGDERQHTIPKRSYRAEHVGDGVYRLEVIDEFGRKVSSWPFKRFEADAAT